MNDMRAILDEVLEALAWGEKIDATARDMMVVHAKKALEINKKMNLTRIVESREVVDRHIVDSLWLIPAMESWGWDIPHTFYDIGSGGGWPFFPLKAVWRKAEGTCVEKSQKKARFLQSVCDDVVPRANVISRQAREIKKCSADLVTSRAVGTLGYLFKETHHILKPDGLMVCYKGPSVEEELDEWTTLCEKHRFEELPPVSFHLKDGSERHMIAARASK